MCSVGLNHIDTKYAEEKGIKVFNAPGLNGNAVAELTICKMLELSRHTIPAHRDVTVNQKWDKYAFVGRELRARPWACWALAASASAWARSPVCSA